MVRTVNGTKQYLLGKKYGESYWLEEGHFDCGWYWGLGYVESYKGMAKSDKLWRGHQHFDCLFLKGDEHGKVYVDAWENFFDESPLSKDDVWELCELMKSAYTCRQYSDMLHCCGSHITSRVKVEEILNKAEYDRINQIVIPTILNNVYELLEDK